jgi:hypothetical protein
MGCAGSSLSGGLEAGNVADVDLALGVPRIVRGLHPEPHAGTVAEELAEPDGNGR